MTQPSYATEAKREYRDAVYIAAMMGGWDPASGDVMIMPGPTDEEICALIDLEVHQERIHVVDSNPAIVATHKRRFPGIQTHGVSLRRALKRIIERGHHLSFLHADFCGGANSAFEELVNRGIALDGVVVVNVAGGRESRPASGFRASPEMKRGAKYLRYSLSVEYGNLSARHSHVTQWDWSRVATVGLALGCERADFVSVGKYRNHRTPMVWSAWRTHRGRGFVYDRAVAKAAGFHDCRHSSLSLGHMTEVQILHLAMQECSEMMARGGVDRRREFASLMQFGFHGLVDNNLVKDANRKLLSLLTKECPWLLDRQVVRLRDQDLPALGCAMLSVLSRYSRNHAA